jgi:hypothetical protein
MYGKQLIIYVAFVAAVFWTYCPDARAQGIRTVDEVPHTREDSLFRRIMEMEKRMNELSRLLEEQKKEEEIQRLLEEAERLSARAEEQQVDVSKKYFSGVRQQQGLNPNISFGMDFFGGLSTADVASINKPGHLSYGNNGIFLREAELSLVAPLDPFARGKGFLTASPEGVFVDEVYLEWLNLPLNTTLKTGIFKPEFGFLNRYHNHALPQFDRPRVLMNLFEKEGLGGPGLAASFMLPALISHASLLDVSMIYTAGSQVFRPDSLPGLIYTAQFLNYYDLSSSTYLEARLSAAAGKNGYPGGTFQSYVASAGLALKWAPVGREKYRTIDWKSEILFSSLEYSRGNHRGIGFYSSIQCKVGSRFWLSGRAGYSEIPYDPSQKEWDYTLAVDFWQSEFVCTRFQYQYNDREITVRKDVAGPFPSDHSFILQVIWAMGPHKHEAY